MSLDDFKPEDIKLSKPKQETISKDDSLWTNLQFREFVSNMCSGTLSEEDEKKLVEVFQKIGEYPNAEYLNPLISNFSKIMKDEATQAKLEQIILRVVSEHYMPDHEADFSTEYYGYYYSHNNEIVVCPERIMNAPAELEKQGRHISSRELYVVVLVHALAHALMDPTRYDIKYSGSYQPLITIKNGFSEREVLMEESLATMITLQYFAKSGQPVVNYGEVREFIELQPLPYSFGIDQFYLLNQPDWRPWREAKRSTRFIIKCKKM